MKSYTELPSKFQIGDEVSFVPMFKHQQELGTDAGELEGEIVAIRFTPAKVFYDIVDNYWGKVFDNVSSEKVWMEAPVTLQTASQQ